MATLEQAIEQGLVLIRTLTGIKAAPAYPVEDFNSIFPFVVAYPGSGTASFDATQRLNLDTIIIELHVARLNLPQDVQNALPYVDSIPNVLMNGIKTTKWASTIETLESITWTFGDLGWGDAKTIGFRFSVNGVKRHIAFT